jgi:Xaa-Pro aminopeptidase
MMTLPAKVVTERPFDDEEMERRIVAVRHSMQKAEIDLLLVTDPHDIYYLTAGRELGGLMQLALVVPLSGEFGFAARAVDVVAFVAHTGARKVFAYRDHEPAENAIAAALCSYKIPRPRIGFQAGSPTLPVAVLDRIKALTPEARWADTTRIVWDIAAIKSTLELEHQRRAAAINAQALDRAIRAVAPGVSDNHIAAELIAGMLEAGSHPIPHFNLATGPRTAVVHATYNDRRLEADEIVHFEFTAARFRYTAPLMRTCTLGKPHPAAKRLNDAAIDAVDAALAIIREGVTSGAVDKAANNVLERHGVRQWHYHRTGYMVGISDPSGWALGHIGALRQDDPMILRENMTFHLPMVLFQPGVAGAGLSATVRVTKTGVEVLTSYRKELIAL